MLQLLEDSPMPPEQRDLVSTARYSGNALVRIISDILDFSRMESGKMQLLLEAFDVKTAILSSLRLFQQEAERKNLRFDIAVDPAIPEVLKGDDARFRQIIFNLVGNAFKFTERGSVHVECSVTNRLPDGKVRLKICVADTGIGIPSQKQQTVFEAFTQVDNSSTRKYPGTGLGLSIVKRLATLMQGEVRLASTEGKGTVVTCELVLETSSERLSGDSSGDLPDDDRTPVLLPLNILVAEDDAVGRFAIRTFLERMGHNLVCVENGKQALQALQLFPFDCLFTDIQMPNMDGVELAQRIRTNDLNGTAPTEAVRILVRKVFPQAACEVLSIDPGCLIVAVSAHTMAGDKDRFLRQGIDYYISKPIDAQQLHDVLRRITADICEHRDPPGRVS